MSIFGADIKIPPLAGFPRPSHSVGYQCWCRGKFDPVINRHTGKPHEHKREIARRARQQAAKEPTTSTHNMAGKVAG